MPNPFAKTENKKGGKSAPKKKAQKKKSSPKNSNPPVVSPVKPQKNPLSTTQQRNAILKRFAEKDFSPVEELMEYAKDEDVPVKERISILRFLALYESPQPKAVDLNADMKMNVSVTLTSYSKTKVADLDSAQVVEVPLSAYDEFETEDQ